MPYTADAGHVDAGLDRHHLAGLERAGRDPRGFVDFQPEPVPEPMEKPRPAPVALLCGIAFFGKELANTVLHGFPGLPWLDLAQGFPLTSEACFPKPALCFT